MIRLSFIVPFYNVELYIEECIRSLYNQDIPQEEYEVICVDDCSPDGSRAIVERLQKEFPTLHLLTTSENLRQGGARNLGLEHAQGQYVWFFDSDDSIEPKCLSNLLTIAEEGKLEVVRIFSNLDQDKDIIAYGPCTGSEFVFDAPMNMSIDQRCSSTCMGPILRSHLMNNNIWYTPKVQFEDDDIAYQFYAKAKRMQALPLVLYHIRCHPNSTTRSKYTLTTMDYLLQQMERVMAMDVSLSAYDSRWHTLIKRGTAWSCKWQILEELRKMSEEDIKEFYIRKIGRRANLYKYISPKILLSMRYYWFYKYIYLRNV